MAVLNPFQQSPIAHVGLIYHIGNLGTMSVTALHDELNYLAFDEEENSQKSKWFAIPMNAFSNFIHKQFI